MGSNAIREMKMNNRELRRLREEEPPTSKFSIILRSAIMGYELADIQKFAVKTAQENIPIETKIHLEENAKLGLADLITQCQLLCLDMNWNFEIIQNLGLENLKERHSVLKTEGYSEEE